MDNFKPYLTDLCCQCFNKSELNMDGPSDGI